MNRFMKIIVIMSILTLFVGTAFGQDVNVGKMVFATKCESCHKLEGKGIAPNISVLSGKTPSDIRQIVRNGIPNTAMVPFSTNDLSDNELYNVIGYIESTNASITPITTTTSPITTTAVATPSPTPKSPGFDIFLSITVILALIYSLRFRKNLR